MAVLDLHTRRTFCDSLSDLLVLDACRAIYHLPKPRDFHRFVVNRRGSACSNVGSVGDEI